MRRPIDDELNPPEITGKIRVLIWGNTFPRVGGVERFVDNLAHGLIERGHAVAVLSDGKIIANESFIGANQMMINVISF